VLYIAVGKGVYGDVMLARTRVDDDDDVDDTDADSLVMVKSLLSRNEAHVATCRREVELFSRVSHDHVTRLVALCCKMEPLYLVTEYCEWVGRLVLLTVTVAERLVYLSTSLPFYRTKVYLC